MPMHIRLPFTRSANRDNSAGTIEPVRRIRLLLSQIGQLTRWSAMPLILAGSACKRSAGKPEPELSCGVEPMAHF